MILHWCKFTIIYIMKFFNEHFYVSLEHFTFSCKSFSLSIVLSSLSKSKNELGHVWYCLWIWALSKKYTNDLLPEIYTTTLEWKHVVVTYSKEWKLQKHRSGKKSIYIFNKRSLQSLKKTPWPSHVQQCLPFEIAILTTHDP